LASGGFGEVFEAFTPEGERVAVKVLKTVSRSAISVVQQEIRTLSQISHPNVVRILGFSGESSFLFGEEKGPCFWMEYIIGSPLRSQSRPGGLPDWENMSRWLVESLEALDDLHRRGLVHGDVSPQNVLVDESGHIKLIDFGLSLLRTETSALIHAANLKSLAPERIGGRMLPASDLYSLGVLFYDAFALQHPKEGAKSLHDLLQKEASPLRSLVPEWPEPYSRIAKVIDGLVKNDLADRYATAEEALASLERDLKGKPKTAPFHSNVFWGAEAILDKLSERINSDPTTVSIVAVHGGSGVGKARFVRDLGLRTRLMNVAVSVRERLEDISPADLPKLLRDIEMHRESGKGLLILEWNDQRLSSETRDSFGRLAKWETIIDVPLQPLSERDTSALIEMALPPEAVSSIGKALFERTGGVPSQLLKAIDLILARGDGARYLTESDCTDILKQLGQERSSWHSTLATPSTDDLQALRALAAGYEPCDLSTLEKVLMSLGTVSVSWTRLLQERLVILTLETGRARLAPAGLRAAVLEELDPTESRRLHAEWWRTLPKEDSFLPDRLHHALSLGWEDKTCDLFFAVSDLLWDQGRRSESLLLTTRALEVVRTPVPRARILKEKMNLQADRGDYEDALQTAEEWMKLGPDNDPIELKTVKYLFATATHHLNLDRKREASERFLKALEAMPSQMQGEFLYFAARSYALLARIHLETGDLSGAAELIARGSSLPGLEDSHRSEFARLQAQVASRQGDPSATHRWLAIAHESAERSGSLEGQFSVLLLEGNLALSAENPDQAALSYRRALELATAQSHPLFQAQARNNLSILERQRGHPEEALELARKAASTLRLVGRRRDFEEALKTQAEAQIALGLWKAAEATLAEVTDPAMAASIHAFYEERKNGLWLEPSPNAPAAIDDWNQERALRSAHVAGDKSFISGIVKRIRKAVFKEHRASFDDVFEKLINREISMNTPSERPTIAWENITTEVNGLSRRLLIEEDMEKVLDGLMDAAMKIARARHGFLILQDLGEADPASPIAGYKVAKARNFDNVNIEPSEQALSFSVVRRAIDSKSPVVTDNALADARFKESESIQLSQLKSIVALPLLGPTGILGVFYLDHPLEEGLFGGEILKALDLFAGVAAMALQKAQMIAGLKRSNADLSQRVDEQASEVELLQREVKNSRLVLKNEYSDIIGRSPRMLQALSLVDRLTDTKIPVWIFGESGTGKEAVARALHFNSGRKNQPFVSENCSALPESLLESELFGHKKGAFTHATSDKKGLLQYADKGTIFLDEVADMPLNLQAKLLRFLQEGEVRPIGSTTPLRVDVRVISASNKDLANLVREGKFREDLYFRLNGITVKLPPLRERLEDLPILAEHFLKKASERDKRKAPKIHPKALKLLLGYSWPGNIRELQNTMETSALFAEGNFITIESLRFKDALFGAPPPVAPISYAPQIVAAQPMTSQPPLMPPAASETTPQPVYTAPPPSPPPPAKTRLNPDLERILVAIRDNCFNKANAAKELGMSRRHLYTKLEGYGVKPDEKTLKGLIEKHL